MSKQRDQVDGEDHVVDQGDDRADAEAEFEARRDVGEDRDEAEHRRQRRASSFICPATWPEKCSVEG